MALSRINGREDLFVGGVFTLRRPSLLQQHKITHILSVIKYSLDKLTDPDQILSQIEHLSIDIDDLASEDILVHFPKMVRFIERGLYGDEITGDQHKVSSASREGKRSKRDDEDNVDAILPVPVPASLSDAGLTAAQLARLHLTPTQTSTRGPTGPQPTGAVLVHCAMGKSRSVSAIVAYLLWKYPGRFGGANTSATPREAVMKALKWVRETRPVAGPNDGFMRQLEMWWAMGCPAGSDDAVEREPVYQAWLAKREGDDRVQESEWIVFENERDEEIKPAQGFGASKVDQVLAAEEEDKTVGGPSGADR